MKNVFLSYLLLVYLLHRHKTTPKKSSSLIFAWDSTYKLLQKDRVIWTPNAAWIILLSAVIIVS